MHLLEAGFSFKLSETFGASDSWVQAAQSGMQPRWVVVVCALVVGFSVSLPAQPDAVDLRCLEGGVAACLERAKQGDAAAQYLVGRLYSVGGEGRNSLPQDIVEAVRWYRTAAAQGHALALLDLGVMYASGEGVPLNDVRAYLWLSLAADALVDGRTTAKDLAVRARDEVAERLTTEQRMAVQAQTAKCKASGFKDCGEPAP